VIEVVVSGILCVVLVVGLAKSLASVGGSGEANGGMTGNSYSLLISIITYTLHLVLMVSITFLSCIAISVVDFSFSVGHCHIRLPSGEADQNR
jgi:uncharacterized membrane protein